MAEGVGHENHIAHRIELVVVVLPRASVTWVWRLSMLYVYRVTLPFASVVEITFPLLWYATKVCGQFASALRRYAVGRVGLDRLDLAIEVVVFVVGLQDGQAVDAGNLHGDNVVVAVVRNTRL